MTNMNYATSQNTTEAQTLLNDILAEPEAMNTTRHFTKNKIAEAMEKIKPSAHDKLTEFFAPYKKQLELKVTGEEPNTFEDMTERVYGLNTVLKALNVNAEAANDSVQSVQMAA
jgi:hypothetical protein